MIQNYLTQAELALAAYATLTTSIPDENALKGEGMAAVQASTFALKWSVVDQYTDSVTGVSATVFQEAATGKRFLAIRGTEPDDVNDLITDVVDIALLGTSAIQTQYTSLKAKVQTWLGDGTLPSSFTVSGHSLGGFLATALTADFAANITQTYLYNAPGLDGVVGDVIEAILNTFGITAPLGLADVFNIKANAGTSPIAGLGAQVAPAIDIHIEDQFFSDVANPPLSYNHSQRVLTDSLALYAVYAQLDPTASVTTITNVIKANSNLNGNTLELALDNLCKLLLGSAVPGTVPEGRESYYTNLDQLTDLLEDRAGPALKLDALTSYGGTTIASKALANTADGLAYRYAITTLNPFAVTGDAGIYASHNVNGELNLYDPATGQGTLTAQYLKDRAKMLSWKMQYDTGAEDADDDPLGILSRNDKPYTEDWDSWTINGDWDFIDHAAIVDGSPLKLTIDGVDWPSAPNHQIVFGTNNADSLIGDELSDNLYGGGGDDVIDGGDGNDYIEGNAGDDVLHGGFGNDILVGGMGFDTYYTYAGEGYDVIEDSDGLGVIKFGAIEAKGKTTVTDPSKWIQLGNVWQDQEHGITYGLATLADGSQTLFITGLNGSTVEVKGWSDGDLGIDLGAGAQPSAIPTPATGTTIEGDLKPHDHDPQAAGIQEDHDSLGNVIVDSEAAANRQDTLYDSTGNDHLLGHGGNDTLYAWRGGDDLLEGGAGQDTLSGGAGHDLLAGGTDSDVLIGGAGDDHLFAQDQTNDLAAAILAAETQPGSGSRGDWLSGDDGTDTLVGDAGNDVLFGDGNGNGNGILIGGTGVDTLIGGDGPVQDAGGTEADLEGGASSAVTANLTLQLDDAGGWVYGGAGNESEWRLAA